MAGAVGADLSGVADVMAALVRWLAAVTPLIAMGALYAYWHSIWWAILGGIFWPFTLGYLIILRYIA